MHFDVICLIKTADMTQFRAQNYNASLKLSRPYLKVGKFDTQKHALKTY